MARPDSRRRRRRGGGALLPVGLQKSRDEGCSDLLRGKARGRAKIQQVQGREIMQTRRHKKELVDPKMQAKTDPGAMPRAGCLGSA